MEDQKVTPSTAQQPHVTKRDKAVVPFNPECVRRAVRKARAETENADTARDIPQIIADRVTEQIMHRPPEPPVDVETIQDMVEVCLMSEGEFDTARRYILYREEHKKARNERQHPDKDAMADYLMCDKYALYRPDLGRRETYAEAVTRVKEMHLRRYPEAELIIEEAFRAVYDKKVLPSMRSMQFGGRAVERNHLRGYNCSFSLCDRPAFFSEAMYMLLCGTGVGFSVEFEHVEKLPALTAAIDETRVRHVTIADTIEGWADAVKALVDSYFTGELVEFNYSDIRHRGAAISSGGKAPGHVPLRRALENCRRLLDRALGRKLKPIECYDLTMYIADAVISGGVRRSATISLFSPDDGEMMNAKTGDWMRDNPQRGRSNNSVKLMRGEVTKGQFMRVFGRVKEWGEPGFVFMESLDHGVNPCAEVGIDPVLRWQDEAPRTGWGLCNLTEINGAAIKTKEDFAEAVRAATIIGTLQAGYAEFPYLGEVTEEIVRRDALLGVSITGVMDSPEIILNEELQREMAEYAVSVNKEAAAILRINSAMRVTCVKPAGSTSLLLGTASGIHPRHARRYFRRVQANKSDPVYQYFKKVNPHMCEESVWSRNKTDEVITFCVESSEQAKVKDMVSALELLETVRSTQLNWVKPGSAETGSELHHNVSCTVTVKEDEWDAVAEYIWEHRADFTGLSFLPASGDKAYPQAPHEEVATVEDEARWNRLISGYTPVDYTLLQEAEDNTERQAEIACAGGSCSLI